MTHFSGLVGIASNPGIQVVDFIGWTYNQGGASVDDGLAATRTGHSLSIDGNAVRKNTRRWIMTERRFVHFMFCC